MDAETQLASFTIRPAVTADYEQLCAIWEVGDALHREAHPEMFGSSGQPFVGRDSMAALIAGPDSTILVAVIGADVIGLITLAARRVAASAIKIERRYVEIENMAVRPLAQRQGVGRALMDQAAGWATTRGISDLELNVFAFNAAATAFYRDAGFSPVLHRMSRRI
jgi:GNAT superfamily N-acetyltransferase